MKCDKCGGLVSVASEYDTCVRCGKVNYDKAPNRYEIETPIVFKGNQNTLPYWGSNENNFETTVSVFMVSHKVTGKLYSRPMCPECNKRMKAINHARKADYNTKVSKTPYHCSNKHKIVIHTKQQVMMGWSE
jgi:ssDNA-binding Zn-finger/Zn-ribbon topoisomerase 1